MRIRVRFRDREAVKLPINQNYFLAAAVYSVLGARPDYARFLHDHGYTHEASGRAFKLFVFSPLMCKTRRVAGQDLILGPGAFSWVISSPMPEFVTALAEGLLSQGEIDMRGVTLPIETVEAEAEPEFAPEIAFTCLSPIVAAQSTPTYANFLTHEDQPEFSEHVRKNLIRKFELIHGRPPDDDSFRMEFDQGYIARRDGRVTKLIDIRGVQIRGVLAPFAVKGSVALIRVGYECGFGERGSMGFGCVGMDRKNKDSDPPLD
ncbi:MAG: CRISPR-associated endoribonuclease Cas6 [Armatimonadota bacterium]|nr:CRISPR-associated endoribonuclease Cas6 [Armatimonadota bacterium]